jgi:hypothetical protein
MLPIAATFALAGVLGSAMILASDCTAIGAYFCVSEIATPNAWRRALR